MIRLVVRMLALAVILAVPATASAQKDNKYTKEAQKFMGLAMTKADPAQKNQLYVQALAQLEEGLVKEPEHAKTWLLAGQVHAALNHFVMADSAFRVAVQLHPPYAEDISAEREQAWIAAFNLGAEAMNAGKFPDAIAALEQAQMMYKDRPEGLMNLGVLYANQNQPDKAAEAFEAARVAAKGPLFEKLDSAQKAGWVRFDEMARINLAQLAGQRGVDAFTARNFDEAIAAFQKAQALNPYSRDYIFNLAQSIWAKGTSIEEKLDSMPKPKQAETKAQLTKLYLELDSIAAEVIKVDPTSEMLYIIRARSHRMMGEYAGNAAGLKKGQDQAVAHLEQREALPVEISEIMIQSEPDAAVVRGSIKNRKLTAGGTTSVTFTLVGIDGRVVGEQAISITLPEKDQSSTFEGRIPTTGEIAGWRYKLNP